MPVAVIKVPAASCFPKQGSHRAESLICWFSGNASAMRGDGHLAGAIGLSGGIGAGLGDRQERAR